MQHHEGQQCKRTYQHFHEHDVSSIFFYINYTPPAGRGGKKDKFHPLLSAGTPFYFGGHGTRKRLHFPVRFGIVCFHPEAVGDFGEGVVGYERNRLV
jgi:hypothetical protein